MNNLNVKWPPQRNVVKHFTTEIVRLNAMPIQTVLYLGFIFNTAYVSGESRGRR